MKLIKINPLLLAIATMVVVIILFAKTHKTNAVQEEGSPTAKIVQIFDRERATIDTIATAEETNMVDIYSQTGGIVSNINVYTGQQIDPGKAIVQIANNYTNGNAAKIQAQIAEKQYQNAKDNMQKQLDIVDNQKEIASRQEENSEELRKIAEASLNDTQETIQQSKDLLETITDPDALASLEATLKQLEAQERTLSYQANNDSPANKLADLSRDLTIKQLDLQKKSVEFQVEVAQLSSIAAQINASLFSPASPSYGTVEAIYVHQNEVIQPGTKIATIKTSINKTTYVAYIPHTLYKYIDTEKKAVLKIDSEYVVVNIDYISDIPVNGLLHQVKISINKDQSEKFVGRKYLPLSLSLNVANQLVPLSALYQSQNDSYIYVQTGETVETKQVISGEVAGNYVEILSGLESNDVVVTSRNVLAGDTISIQ